MSIPRTAIIGDWVVTNPEFAPTRIDLDPVTSTTVSSNPCILRGVWVNTALSAHAVEFTDNAVSKFTLPASTQPGWYPFGDAVMYTNLIVTNNAAATGNITVLCRNLGDAPATG